MKWYAANTDRYGSIALSYLTADPSARLFLDAEMTVIWASPQALTLIEAMPQLEISERRLWFKNRNEHQAVFELFQSAESRNKFHAVPVEAHNGHVLVQVKSFDDDSGAPTFVVTLIHATPTTPATYARLDLIFGLTSAEYRTLLGLLDGMNADALALRAGVSIETVRTHIRRIYVKLGVTSREALFFRLRSYRL